METPQAQFPKFIQQVMFWCKLKYFYKPEKEDWFDYREPQLT